MGRLNLPDGSRVYLDTSPFIYTVQEIEKYWQLLDSFWTTVSDGFVEVITSELTLLETLVYPIRIGDLELANSFEQLLNSPTVELIPIRQSTLRKAADLRAHHNLKTPDAIHAATAITSGCQHLLANDNGFRRLTSIDVIILDDLI